jgi:hypothetical protein
VGEESEGKRADQTAPRPPSRPNSMNFSKDFSSPKTRPSIRPEASPSARPRVRPSAWYCSSNESNDSKGSAEDEESVLGLVVGWGSWDGVDMMCGFVGWMVDSIREGPFGIGWGIDFKLREDVSGLIEFPEVARGSSIVSP